MTSQWPSNDPSSISEIVPVEEMSVEMGLDNLINVISIPFLAMQIVNYFSNHNGRKYFGLWMRQFCVF